MVTHKQAQKRAEEFGDEITVNQYMNGALLSRRRMAEVLAETYMAAWNESQAVIEKLVEALEYYAEIKHYSHDRLRTTGVTCNNVLEHDLCDLGDMNYYAGRRARQALKQWKEGGV